MASSEKLMQVIHIQTEIAKLGLDLGGVMQFVVDQTLSLVEAEGAAIELAEDGEMVYRAASGVAAPQLGLRLKIEGSLSGLSVMTGETMFCEDSEILESIVWPVRRWGCDQCSLCHLSTGE